MPPVHLHDGTALDPEGAHVAVVAIDVGKRDLQQCADAVIRLRAEWLWSAGRADEICFRFTSGDEASWRRWREGWRPVVGARTVAWDRLAAPDASRQSFRAYLDVVFTYAGTRSLGRGLVPVADPSRPEIGDVFVEAGSPGHAVLVADVAEDAKGRRVMLLAQSFMPAQEIHVLAGTRGALGAWYPAAAAGGIDTPTWTFQRSMLRRFPVGGCP